MEPRKGDLAIFEIDDRKMTGKVLIVNEHDSTCDLEAIDGQNEKNRVKHLPKAEMTLVGYLWSADGAIELCRKERGECYYCGMPLTGECIILTSLRDGEVYHLHEGCSEESTEPYPTPKP